MTGVFSGSLPGSWGRLLTDLVIRENGGEPQAYGPLERLAIVGSSGMEFTDNILSRIRRITHFWIIYCL